MTKTDLPAIDELSELRPLLSARAPVRPIIWRGRRAWAKLRMPLRLHERLLLRFAPLMRKRLAPDIPFIPAPYRSELPIEVQRLRTLHAQGWRVPEVLAAERDIFVTADLGRVMGSELPDESDPAVRRRWLLDIVCDLAAFHTAGQWHGAAQLRNIVRTADDGLGRIDFETQLDRYLPLPLLQAFDAALLFTSVVRTRDRSVLPEMARLYRDAAPQDAREALQRGLPLVRRLAGSRLLQRLMRKEAERLRVLASLPLEPEIVGTK